MSPSSAGSPVGLSAVRPVPGPAARLLLIAHGTASRAGTAAVDDLVEAVRAQRLDVRVDRCYLDVVDPRLPDALDESATVAVPLLLSTGYHVETDIPTAIAAHPSTRVARHLGPDDRLTDVLLARLGPVADGGSVVLVGAGSSRSSAADELRAAADLLAARLGRPVEVRTVSGDLASLTELPRPVHVATYLLSPGRFVDLVRDAVGDAGVVAEPLGVHPALVDLVWARYDGVASAWS